MARTKAVKTDFQYRLVVFEDLNDGSRFLLKSSAKTSETTKYSDGQTYPLVKVHISRNSHPYYTGQEKTIDVEGRIDKFKARRQFAEQAKQARQAQASKQAQSQKPAAGPSQIRPVKPVRNRSGGQAGGRSQAVKSRPARSQRRPAQKPALVKPAP